MSKRWTWPWRRVHAERRWPCWPRSRAATTADARVERSLLGTRTRRSAATAAGSVTLGSKNFPEQYILGELYKQALEAKGFTVSYKKNVGSTELIHAALESGKIDMYPEYTGTALTAVFEVKNPPKTRGGASTRR